MKEYSFLSKKISGQFTIPSGIITTEVSTIQKIAEIPEIGIITTKSIGLVPREGNKEPIIAEYSEGNFVNAVGLTNPGAEEFAKRLEKIKIPSDKFLLISIFGSNLEEFVNVAKILSKYADGFELNFSCPHASGYGMSIGREEEAIKEITKAVKAIGKPVVPKLTPNVPNIGALAKAVVEGGADAICAINTVGPGYHMQDGFPILTNKLGGLSGKAILPIGLKCVKEISSVVNVPILAMGGISSAEDIKNYQKAGASFFGIGSSLAGMNTDDLKNYFRQLALDLENNTNNSTIFLKSKLNMKYKKFILKENKRLTEDFFILQFDQNIKVDPGQFIFAWLPEKGEKPFSVLDDEPLTLFVKKKGFFTTELSKLNSGDSVYIRGPYGNKINLNEKTLVVGGGCGIASLYLFTKKNKGVSALLGAKNLQSLPYLEKFKEVCNQLYIVTESGDSELKGIITDHLSDVIKKVQPITCINCGPEPMIRAVIQEENKILDKDKIYSSIDFMTKCGIGLCGSCATSKGYRMCVDGTFFNLEKL